MAREDNDIARLRERFVCVRITRMNGVNIRRFEFDFDTTWAAFFLDEKLNVYSRYGGRDEGEPDDRLNKESLLQTMNEVLQLHANRPKHSLNQAPIVQPVPQGISRPSDIALLRKNQRGCVHCHQVKEYRFLQSYHDGEFSRRKLFGWPLPENLGLKLDPKHGHRIAETEGRSPAGKADLLPGDEIIQINNVPIHSELDIRWALHRASENKPLRFLVRRQKNGGDGRMLSVELHPEENWRQTDLSWRKSMRSVPMDFAFRGYSLTRSQRKSEGLKENQLAIRVVSVRDRGLAKNLGLQKRDSIIALEGKSKRRTMEQFKSDLLNRYKPGDEVRITVRRDGKNVTLKGLLPDWHTAETTVP
ncbi:MAG: PDZ domain-containing protein [Planctomycetes bacterium]|nr:PDZ domain-containing protein [Planctomycetota bacterium]